MTQEKINNSPTQSKHRSKGAHLFLAFSLLSFAMFVIIGYAVVSAIRPGITDFIISRQEADVVVFVNRLANRFLLPEDFITPSSEAEKRLAVFIEGLQVPARMAVFVANRNGEILASDVPGYTGTMIERSPSFLRAARDLRSVAIFTTLNPKEQQIFGVEEAFELFIPVTFGVSPETAGVVHTLSRTGFIRKIASDLEQKMILRVSVGLAALYLLLSVIVWGASRTIQSQASELARYAATLEKRVRERTRELEQSTAREIAAAKEVARLKDEFVFIATHELRSPVTTLQWSVESLEKDRDFYGALADPIRKRFSFISVSVKRLHALITDLLNVARLESGTVQLEKKPVSLASLLPALLTEFEPPASEKKITLVYESEAFGQLPFVMGDELRLREVFSNLLSNAIKFNKPGGRITVEAKSSGKFLAVSMRDTGIGIAKKEIPNVFTKFFRTHLEIEGTGLGLWISKEIMRRLNGDITVTSEEGVGSTFTITIPRASSRT